MSELKPCDKDVFERGTVLCIFEGSSEEAEEFCKERTKHTGNKHDWHTFAGRKVVKYLATEPDTIQVSRAEYEADGFSLDYSTGTPILMHKDCSVIEGELAEWLLQLISRSRWQPIETVPKDRTKVLVGCFKQGAERYGLVAVDWYRTRENSDASYVGFGCFNDSYFPATHWMHLPAPYAAINMPANGEGER